MNISRLSSRERDVIAAVQLCADASLQEIAARIGQPVHTVRYTITKLRDAKVITPFPFINVYPLGYELYGIFISLAGNAGTRKRVVESLIASPNVAWVLRLGGDFQYGIGLCVTRSHQVTSFLRNLAETHGDIFYEKSVAVRVSCTLFRRGYLSSRRFKDRPLSYGDIGRQISIDALDHYILRGLTALPPGSIRELAGYLGIPHTTATHRLKRLRETGIISGIAMGINAYAIGMHPFRLLLYVTKVSANLREAVYQFAANHPNVLAFIECVGSWDYELKVEVESPAALSAVTDALYDKFGGTLHTVKVLSVLETTKLAFYPVQDIEGGDSANYVTVAKRLPRISRYAWD